MHHVKPFIAGAAIYFLTTKIAAMDFVTSASPTVAKYAPYGIAGGLTLAAHKFLK